MDLEDPWSMIGSLFLLAAVYVVVAYGLTVLRAREQASLFLL